MKSNCTFPILLLSISSRVLCQPAVTNVQPVIPQEPSIMAVLIDKYQQGGPIMWMLAALSVIAFAFALERIIVLVVQGHKLSPSGFLKVLENTLAIKDKTSMQKVEGLTAYCEKRGGVTSVVMLEAMDKWKQAVKQGFPPLELKSWIQTAVDEKSLVATPVLEARLGALANIAGISPLIGLLGTVTGMIMSFDKMAESQGGARPDELAGGISVALITTAGGLIVAIPVLLIHGLIKAWIDNRINQIEEAALVLVDELVQLTKD